MGAMPRMLPLRMIWVHVQSCQMQLFRPQSVLQAYGLSNAGGETLNTKPWFGEGCGLGAVTVLRQLHGALCIHCVTRVV